MLIAELHGKVVEEALSSEDYLTSAVFGELRHVRPGNFWRCLLHKARSLPIGGAELNVATCIEGAAGIAISQYESVEIVFWPQHPLGEPDLVLIFRSPSAAPVVVVVEAKLNAGKSGCGPDDQLARYLCMCDDTTKLRPAVPQNAITMLIFLTAQESRTEIQESLAVYGETEEARARLFRLQWQDIADAADECAAKQGGNALLRDVSAFLKRRGLEYFRGMTMADGFTPPSLNDAVLLSQEAVFSIPAIPAGLESIRGSWADDN